MNGSLMIRGTLIALLFMLTGCASGAKVFNMIPTDMSAVKNQQPYSVALKTAGGRDTQWWGTSQISDESFHQALFDALSKSGAFREVLKEGKSDYILDVFITKVQQPLIGFNMTVSVSAKWKLLDAATHNVVYEDMIITPYEVKVSEEFMGIERLRKANEGAVRENIKKGIVKLSEIKLQK